MARYRPSIGKAGESEPRAKVKRVEGIGVGRANENPVIAHKIPGTNFARRKDGLKTH